MIIGFSDALTYEFLKHLCLFFLQIDVLKKIGCIDADLVVQIKGRVACEMNSGEELISTECLFENQLDDLEPEEAVALMSALVFQQRNTSDPSLTPKLAHARKRLFPHHRVILSYLHHCLYRKNRMSFQSQ